MPLDLNTFAALSLYFFISAKVEYPFIAMHVAPDHSCPVRVVHGNIVDYIITEIEVVRVLYLILCE